MTMFDIAVLVIVGLSALVGLSRGFVQEVLSLAAWFAAAIALILLHTPLTDQITRFFANNQTNSALIAFVILLVVPVVALRLLGRWAGAKARKSVLNPVDRVLGIGFGLVKGVLLVVLTFSIIAIAYDTVWSAKGRPDWVRTARTYPFINAASKAMVTTVSERREALMDRLNPPDEASDAAAADEATTTR